MSQIANGSLFYKTHLVISELSGLGKTYYIQKKAKLDNPY